MMKGTSSFLELMELTNSNLFNKSEEFGLIDVEVFNTFVLIIQRLFIL